MSNAEDVASERPIWREHLPLTISGLIATNFLVHIVTLADGNLSIAAVLIVSDPVRIAFETILLMASTLIVAISIALVALITKASISSVSRTAACLALIVTALISLYVESVLVYCATWAYAAILLASAAHAHGKLDRALPAKWRNPGDEQFIIEWIAATRRRVRRQSRWMRITLLGQKFLRKTDIFLLRVQLLGWRMQVWRLQRRARWSPRRPRGSTRKSTPKIGPTQAGRYSPRLTSIQKRSRRIDSKVRDRSYFNVWQLVELRQLTDQVRQFNRAQRAARPEYREGPRFSKSRAFWIYLQDRLLPSVLLSVIAQLLLTLLQSPLPLERVKTADGEMFVGYIVDRDIVETVILEKSPRRVIYVPTSKVEHRELCFDKDSSVSWRLFEPVIRSNTRLDQC